MPIFAPITIKTALLGGIIAPPAIATIRDVVVEELWKITVANIPINKHNFDKKIIASPQQRIKMLELSLEHESHIIDDREIIRGETSYTYDTIRSIKGTNKNALLYLIIGFDNLYSFHNWYEYKKILEECNIIVMLLVLSMHNGLDYPYVTQLEELKQISYGQIL